MSQIGTGAGGVTDRISILGVPVDILSHDQAVQSCVDLVYKEGPRQVATVNPEFVITAQNDDEFHNVLDSADLCIADGIGLIWASRFKGFALRERVAGSELVFDLARVAADNGWRLFLLGAAPGVAGEAAEKLVARFPGLLIAGVHSGSPDPAQAADICDLISNSRADLLYVAYGAPAQDKWIYRNRYRLATVSLAMGVGGSLDFISGRAARAPRIFQRLGLEWFYRLLRQPWRWRRMLALPEFVLRVLFTRNSVRLIAHSVNKEHAG